LSEYLVVPAERAGIELDEFLCLHYPLAGKGFLRRQVNEGRVRVDGRHSMPAQRLRIDQVVIIEFDEEEAPRPPQGQGTELPVLYEDEQLMLIDKPPGIAVEPERWHRDAACVSGALLELAIERAEEESEGAPLGFRPRLAHRIDKDTSGLLCVAKTLENERELRQAFASGDVHKRYLALVDGELEPPAGQDELVIDEPLAPDARRTGRMRVHGGGKASVTRVRPVQRFRGLTLVECFPETGRTHQIRVHLASIGFPLAVDPLYGRRDELLLSEFKRGYRPKPGRTERPLLGRLALHAAGLDLPHASPLAPFEAVEGLAITQEGDRLQVALEPPKDLAQTLRQLAKYSPPRRRH